MRFRMLLFLITSSLLAITSCEDKVVNTENNYNIFSEFYTLSPNNWQQVPDSKIQWFQEFNLPISKLSDVEKAGVMCYYLNQFDAWEAMPSTRVFWNDKDVVYSDELWFSHNLNYLYIDYRNTIPGVAAPPKDQMLIKAVFFDASFRNYKIFKELDWNNYNEVSKTLNLKD